MNYRMLVRIYAAATLLAFLLPFYTVSFFTTTSVSGADLIIMSLKRQSFAMWSIFGMLIVSMVVLKESLSIDIGEYELSSLAKLGGFANLILAVIFAMTNSNWAVDGFARIFADIFKANQGFGIGFYIIIVMAVLLITTDVTKTNKQ